ncbi:MAG TPA: phosphotransferase [Clostridia bacterium]|nr:phosphotransferase [Clostridia bacterium]
MQVKFEINDNLLITAIQRAYGISICQLDFLPKGDSAYCYIIKCSDNSSYFLKLYDNNTDGGKSRIKDLDRYLPLTREMYDTQLFKYLSYPFKNKSGHFSTDLGFAAIILFNYIEGRSLEDDYPFPLDLEKQIACTLAKMHKTTSSLDLKASRFENFELPYVERLKEYLSYLGTIDKVSNFDIKTLRDSILPRKKMILGFLDNLLEYQKYAKQLLHDGKLKMVISHGDVWGGNLIIDEYGNLHLVDWESTIIAPRERDIRNFTGDSFHCFLKEYEKQLGHKAILHTEIFGYYLYNFHLANLTNWIRRILYENKSSLQSQSDLDCIMNHCISRLPSLKSTLQKVNFILKE